MPKHYILSLALLHSQQGKSRPKNVKGIMNVGEIKGQAFLVDWAYFLASIFLQVIIYDFDNFSI